MSEVWEVPEEPEGPEVDEVREKIDNQGVGIRLEIIGWMNW